MSELSTTRTADALDAMAHDLRNELNVVLGAAQLLAADDPELGPELCSAAQSLARRLERLVVAARVERATGPDPAAIEAGDLVDAAVRRARREGCAVEAQVGGDAVAVRVPPAWGERLLADCIHRAGGGRVEIALAAGGNADDADAVSMRVAGEAAGGERDGFLDALLVQLAQACGGRADIDDADVRLVLPRG